MTTVDLERNLDLLASGLFARLRDIRLAEARWDRFVPDPEGDRGGTLPRAAAPSPAERRRVAEEMVLRALRVGVDPVNHRILARLAGGDAVALPALMDETGLPRIPLAERVFDLAQVGLAAWTPESREARATGAAEGLLFLLAELSGRLARILDEKWAAAPASPEKPA